MVVENKENNKIIEDHKEIIKDINNLFEVVSKIKCNIERTGVYYIHHSEILDWCEIEILSLRNCFNMIIKNYVRESLIVIRSVFENYLFLLLALKADKFYKYYTLDSNIDKNKIEKIINEFKQNENVISVEKEGNFLKVACKGLYENNDKTKIISFYYFLIKDYNPYKAHLGKYKDFIDDYMFFKDEEYEKSIKSMRFVYSKYFTINGIIDNLLLNKLITEKEEKKIKVHYNFLSLFLHPNLQFINILTDENKNKTINFLENGYYNLHLTLLSFLYIGFLIKMYGCLLLDYFEQEKKMGRIKEVRNKQGFLESLNEFEKKYNYFWFIFNKPHPIYKDFILKKKNLKQAISGETSNALNRDGIQDQDLHYYENPYQILKEVYYRIKSNHA